MRQYIGTKIIKAEPAYRIDGKVYTLDKYPKAMNREEGYKVVYPDGYESWSPKDVFEEAYRPCENMTFGLAIEAMKKGHKVTRKGWNGKGMFLYLTSESDVSYSKLKPETQRALISHTKSTVHINGHIDMKAADDSIVCGWLASQTDMLAEDWEIVG